MKKNKGFKFFSYSLFILGLALLMYMSFNGGFISTGSIIIFTLGMMCIWLGLSFICITTFE